LPLSVRSVRPATRYRALRCAGYCGGPRWGAGCCCQATSCRCWQAVAPSLSLLHHGFYRAHPFTFALALLRFRLFEIEVIINRTLVYGTLTVLLAGLYLLLVRLFTPLFPILLRRQDDMAVVFIATLGMVLAFAPLRRRVQATIDRAFYRTKLDYQRLLPE